MMSKSIIEILCDATDETLGKKASTKEMLGSDYGIYIKSHCEAPDYEDEVVATSREEAIEKFLKKLPDLDYETINKNVYEISY